jgi:hypothetical protein
VKDGVHRTLRQLSVERTVYIVLDELEGGDRAEVLNVLKRPGEQIIQGYDGVALEEQTVAHMGADESGCSGNDDSQADLSLDGGDRFQFIERMVHSERIDRDATVNS